MRLLNLLRNQAVLVAMLVALPAAAQIPAAADAHRRELTRIVQQEFGLSGSVALHAAQIHQESTWRTTVSSSAGAEGLAQFMPATSAWIAEIYPDLGATAPYSPGWAMRAMVRYNRWHLARVPATSPCDRWAFALSAYNGGLGWVNRDRRLAAERGVDDQRWWCHVEHHTARAAWAEHENRGYVRRILRELESRYRLAGWQGAPTC